MWCSLFITISIRSLKPTHHTTLHLAIPLFLFAISEFLRLQSTNSSSMAFSTAASSFFTPIHSFTHSKLNPNSSLSVASPSMAFIVPSIKFKTPFASSNSQFLRHGFAQLSSNSRGIASNSSSSSSSSGVYARAATEKSIHDFTVKVSAIFFLFFFYHTVCLYSFILCSLIICFCALILLTWTWWCAWNFNFTWHEGTSTK